MCRCQCGSHSACCLAEGMRDPKWLGCRRQPDDRVLLEDGSGSAITVAGRDVQRSVRISNDVTEAAKASLKQTFMADDLGRIRCIQLRPMEVFASEGGKEQVVTEVGNCRARIEGRARGSNRRCKGQHWSFHSRYCGTSLDDWPSDPPGIGSVEAPCADHRVVQCV